MDFKNYFEKYRSNTLAGSSNQTFFISDGQPHESRIYYKIFAGGKFNYSLLFTNTIDSTFADGSHSVCNVVCDGWELCKASVGRTRESYIDSAVPPEDEIPLTFDGKTSKTVGKGERFCSDNFEFEAKSGEYMCVTLTFKGEMIPYHDELKIASFVKTENGFEPSKKTPLPIMIGCDRAHDLNIAFLGDSITQGIGATPNSYLHWNARLANLLGDRHAYWNIGIGYARSGDAASDGIWLERAKHNDLVFVCLGVNDIQRGIPTEDIKNNLLKIVTLLKAAGCRVILQTVPPFDYSPQNTPRWFEINDYIRTALKTKVDGIFDNVPVLGKKDAPQNTVYGGHPDDDGCEKWADALYDYIKKEFTL